MKKIYSDIESGFADGIAIARGEYVFVVDSGKENGDIKLEEDLCILMNKAIKVKFVGEEMYGFLKGKIYQAYEIRGAFPNKHEMISVVDDFGEEYAYPRDWFEIID